MMKQLTIRSCILLGILLSMTWASQGQTVTNQTVLTIQSGLDLTVDGDLLNEAAGELVLKGRLNLKGNLANNSTTDLTTGDGSLNLEGNNPQDIGGSSPSRFFDIIQNNTSGTTLNQNINVEGSVLMQSGHIDLNGQTLNLRETGFLTGESNSSRILGTSGKIELFRDASFVANEEDIAGIGIGIFSNKKLGPISITRSHADNGLENSIQRQYGIFPELLTDNNATLKIRYLSDELNGQNSNSLFQWYLPKQEANWIPGHSSQTDIGVVEGGPYDSIIGHWSLSSNQATNTQNPLPILSVKYFPNPLSELQRLHVEGLEAGRYHLSLWDMSGKRIWQLHTEIDISNVTRKYELPSLPAGAYSLHIISEQYAPVSGMLIIQAH